MSERPLPIPFGWYGVSYSDELKVGEVKPIAYFGKQLVLFRTESGEAKVLDAYCPHLGAHLGHGGKVQGENIACPFHGWQFNGSGQCAAVPYAKNMPPKVANGKQAIYAYPTVERNQMIWTWYHPHRIEPTHAVPVIPEFESSDWVIVERLEWKFNVIMQDAAENACDAAHFVYVHGTTEVPAGEIEFDGIKRIGKYIAKVPKILEDGSFDPSGATANIYLTTISEGTGVAIQRFTGALETVLLGITSPLTANSVIMRFAFIRPKDSGPAQQMMAEFAKMEICRQVEGDIPIWEHKIYLENPTLCDGDGPIHQFRKWYRQFYAELNDTPTNIRVAS
ncbi:MAG TPA: aromatic ring-hydroxylating dioxygenase subunit alpha [Spongiibacteraceae bacterium]|jgi:phenylpropionate dioxygenase-like ring-hydroxylating dioxygenase large terminal subunit